MSSFEEVLERGDKLVYRVRGRSMLPLLHQNRDIVIIEKAEKRLSELDVAFFKLEDNYVLHRVVRVRRGFYITRGDNNLNNEKVPENAVLGVLTGFVQDGRNRSVTDKDYLAYSRKRVLLYPARFVYRKLRGFLHKISKKLKV